MERTQIEQQLHPYFTVEDDDSSIQALASFLINLIENTPTHDQLIEISPSLHQSLQKLLGQPPITVYGKLVSFGQDNNIGNVSIGDVTGGHSVKLTFNFYPVSSTTTKEGNVPYEQICYSCGAITNSKYCPKCQQPRFKVCPECRRETSLISTGNCVSCGYNYNTAIVRAHMEEYHSAQKYLKRRGLFALLKIAHMRVRRKI